MAFHGGLIGVGLATWHVCRTHKIPLLRMTDIAAAATPIGLLLGRCANFINAELYGRPTDGPMGMVFPQGYGSGGPPGAFDWASKTWVYAGTEVPRHPSQLYQFALEGVVLFVILWMFSAKSRPSGQVTGLFFFCYGVFRFAVEFVREPDAHLGFIWLSWMTMGQLLSVPMIAIGVWLLMLRKGPLNARIS